MQSFRLVGLAPEPFAPLFLQSTEALAAIGAQRCVATGHPGFPCRVSLDDAAIGEELLLLTYIHQPADSPYRASGPIYIRRNATARSIAVGEIPDSIQRRMISLRAYDSSDMMITADVHPGTAVATEILQQFANPDVAYIHLHNAKPGCFACAVERA